MSSSRQTPRTSAAAERRRVAAGAASRMQALQDSDREQQADNGDAPTDVTGTDPQGPADGAPPVGDVATVQLDGPVPTVVGEVDEHGYPTDPAARAELAQLLRDDLARIDASAAPPEPPTPPPPPPAKPSPRIGTILGSLEMMKASYRAMVGPDVAPTPGVDQEWALTVGITDLIGQMFEAHRAGHLADPALAADLRFLATQIDTANGARALPPPPA
jgi:hypothetical protein